MALGGAALEMGPGGATQTVMDTLFGVVAACRLHLPAGFSPQGQWVPLAVVRRHSSRCSVALASAGYRRTRVATDRYQMP